MSRWQSSPCAVRQWQVLRCDISTNDVIIDPKDIDGCSGVLINMDLAMKAKEDGTKERTETRHVTGTLRAFELLRFRQYSTTLIARNSLR